MVWEILDKNFGTFSINLILNKTFKILCLYIFTLEYIKDEALHFKDITNINDVILSLNTGLNSKLKQKKIKKEKKNNEVIYFKEKNEYIKKKIILLINFYPRAQPLSDLKFVLFCLLSRSCSQPRLLYLGRF